jgi:EAL domain-containing protein (putative c-di-GMP-specific phosphodiesterase class I)
MQATENGCGACRQGATSPPFLMAFQPVVDVETRRIVAQEALVRGPAGEGSGHVLGQLDDDNLYRFDQACRVRAIEAASRLGVDVRLNINFFPNAVYEPSACIRTTLATARRTGFPLDQITFEIVEGEEVVDNAHLRGIIAEYREHGFLIALDDFATAHSGLARLVELRPDIIKLDRRLTRDCHLDDGRLAVISSMLSLCDTLEIQAVVEGVELAGELEALRSVGARFMQGYLFARPALDALVRDGDIGWPSARLQAA